MDERVKINVVSENYGILQVDKKAGFSVSGQTKTSALNSLKYSDTAKIQPLLFVTAKIWPVPLWFCWRSL